MWVWGFLRHHKTAVVGGWVFGTGCAAYVVAVWQTRFCAIWYMELLDYVCGSLRLGAPWNRFLSKQFSVCTVRKSIYGILHL